MEEDASYGSYLAKGSAFATVALVLSSLLSFGSRMFLSRALSVEEYGLLFAVLSLLSFLKLFEGLGLSSAIVKFVPEFRVKEKFTNLKSTIVITLLVRTATSLAVATILWILAKPIALEFIGTAKAIPVIRILSIWFISMSIIGTGRSIFRALKDIPSNQSIELFRFTIILSIIGIFSYYVDLNVKMAALAFLISGFGTILWILFRLGKHVEILSRGEAVLTSSLTKKLLVFGLPLILGSLSGRVTSHIDTIVITSLLSAEKAGLYQVARPATRILQYAGMAVSIPLFPMISELWSKRDKEKIGSTLYFITKFSFLFLIPATIVFIAFPDVIIRILFSYRYLEAASTVRILSITMVVMVMFIILNNTLLGIGKNILYSKIYGLAAVLNFVGDIMLVPILGIDGAAIAFLTSFSIALILEFYYVRKFIEFPSPYVTIGKEILGGTLTLGIIYIAKYILPFPLWPKLITTVLVGGSFYLIWIFKTATVEKDDVEVLTDILPIPDRIERLLSRLTEI